MIDLKELDNDPFSSYPVNKDDIRALAGALESMEKHLREVSRDAQTFFDALNMIANQHKEPTSRRAARRVLGLEGL